LGELLRQFENERDDLRRCLDEEANERRKSAEEIRQLTLMLTHQQEPKPAEIKSKLFEKLFGRR
jgi:hypothetical protein